MDPLKTKKQLRDEFFAHAKKVGRSTEPSWPRVESLDSAILAAAFRGELVERQSDDGATVRAAE